MPSHNNESIYIDTAVNPIGIKMTLFTMRRDTDVNETVNESIYIDTADNPIGIKMTLFTMRVFTLTLPLIL